MEKSYQSYETAQRPERAECLDSAIGGLDAHVDRLAKIVCRIESLGDRLTGPRPQAIGKDGNAESQPSLLASLQNKSASISSLISQIEDQLSRVSRSIDG